MERHWGALPTAMISFGYPYFLYDAPRVPYLHQRLLDDRGYAARVVDLLLGRLPLNRNSPIDPFVGLPDARY